MKLIMTKGLPGSGKSTWSKEYQKKHPDTVRVNKDDLRAMLHASIHSKGKEEFVLGLRDSIVDKALKKGHDVIVDDTNFNPIHEEALRRKAVEAGAEFVVQDFTAVPLEDCIKRDALRANSVGKKVILQMYNQWCKSPIELVEYNPDIPDCYIFDIDGTLSIKGNRSPYEWSKVAEDEYNFAVVETFRRLQDNNHNPAKFIIFSGRDSSCREITEKWLKDNGIPYDELYMRPLADQTKDSIIKFGMYYNHIKNKYNVIAIFDDRDQVVEMWRSLGLPCFQVAEGDF